LQSSFLSRCIIKFLFLHTFNRLRMP
jgi:hypothetical protein